MLICKGSMAIVLGSLMGYSDGALYMGAIYYSLLTIAIMAVNQWVGKAKASKR